MEAEPLILPDNTIIDPTQPPPSFNFPKPDFTEIVQDHSDPPSDKTEPALLKPTFKSALQAKKRLQAFSSARPGSLPSSPKKLKPSISSEEKSDDGTPPTAKKPFKKGSTHDDKAKAVIEEIEEMKREEMAFLELQRQVLKRSRSRSRSRSPDRGRFKKVEKKSRNYRRRSPSPKKRDSPRKQRESPKKPRESPKVAKKVKKYPKNWREFVEFNATFDINSELDMPPPTGNNELFKQMLFESPSLPIVPFKMKTVNREDKVVPFEYIRYTRAKPVIPHSVNFGAIKESCMTKRTLLDALPKDSVTNIENLYSKSMRFVSEEDDPKVRKTKIWYPKAWKEGDDECKIFEKSVGLSFLQSYTGEEEENDFNEEEVVPSAKPEPEIPEEKVETTIQDEEKRDKEKIIEKEKEQTTEKEEHDVKKKKKKGKKTEDESEEKPDNADKKKKKKHKDKKKNMDENSAENVTKKKKRKKDKLKKKEKPVKDKKLKRRKSKEKKKKDKDKDKEKAPVEKSIEKLSKEQVIEELKEIEEKLAQKRQDKAKKTEKEEKGRKRKHSDREEDAKRTKHEKPRRTSDENDEAKVEHALKRKLEKAKKTETTDDAKKSEKVEKEKSDKHEEHVKKNERKSRHSDEVKLVRKRKSRWSEPDDELPYFMDLKIIEEISKDDPPIIYDKPKKPESDTENVKEVKETTPDTDEYHSHWESEEDISSTVPRHALKMNRSWESDEELFERSHNRSKKPAESYDLEIPLNITNFSRRSSNWEEKPLSVVQELKLLEEERKSLSEERRKLELEKQKILKLQEEAKLDLVTDKKPVVEEIKEMVRLRSATPEEIVKVKKEKCEVNDFSIDSLNNSLLSNVSSTESNFPIAALENEYEEFIKAVSSESSVSVSSKKKPERRNSSSSSWSSDSDHKKRKRKSKLKKKKKKRKARECEGLLVGKGNNIFNEFDIPVPSDLPIEVVPTPVPVPSPIVPIEQILPLTAPNLLLNTIVDLSEKPIMEEPKPENGLDLKKPFVFSSIVLPIKKTPLVDNSNLKLADDDSDSVDFTDKFVKKPEPKETPLEEAKENEEPKEVEKEELEDAKKEEIETQPPQDAKPLLAEIPIPEEAKPKPVAVAPPPQPVPQPIEDIQNVPLPPEKPTPKAPPLSEIRPPSDTKIRRSRSRSFSPPRKLKEKRRSRSRSPKRRSPIRRRDSPPRRRHSSPRRRSPPRRRGSPWRRSPSPKRRSPSPKRRSPSPKRRSLSPKRRSLSPKRRSPSPRRRSPPRRRRRSPSLSPLRSRRKRTPSPRRRASPLNSPLDGFKRSVADSTISDDMLPQHTPEDYNDSPNAYGGGAKYYDRKGLCKKMSLSPQMSPKRIPLDDRINQVLGLEKNEPPPLPPPKPQETYANYGYGGGYGGQYQYAQYGPQKSDYGPPPFGTMMYTQPPPPIVKPVPTPTKVVQVGNILQVVPTEEIPPPPVVEKTTERSQKIVQVGNMLQIVPAVIASPIKVPPPEQPPVAKPVPPPEKQSAEAIMKQKIAERKAEREKRRQERERRRKEKEKKRKEREKRKQMKLKIKTENMIKRAIQIETEALANDEVEEEGESAELPVQWPPVPVIVSATPNCRSILSQGGSKQRKSVQFADGVRPGEGTSPSGGEELSSPPPRKLPKEKRYKKIKIPKKSKKKKVRVKVVKKAPVEEEEDDDEEDNLPPPSPPPGSPPPHIFPSRVKTHTINNVHQYVGNIIQSTAPGFPFRSPMPPMVMNRHQPPPGYMPGAFPTDVGGLSHSHPTYQGVSSHH
ncbi:hypothetical protein Zmor_022265 [Zophobas morio]|uniref:Titin-like n=1 Tax=Zophobas morio TaxID=2755281 RepID=A0AA38M599_9CUCU|nr:hypothetical protein Zmor_022265 [Zophobas morio]